MSDLTNKIIELIKQNKSVNEICEITNLSNKQLFNIISIIGNSGYLFDKKYYYDGDIVYTLRNKILNSINNNSVGIITYEGTNNITFILISDLHFGSKFERIDLMNVIYDYAIKNDINLIVIGGDLIDGTFGSDKKYENTYDQIKHLLNDYPFDKNILSFAVLGDHDYSSLKENGQDLSRILQSYRQDIIPLGYQQGRIRVKKDSFLINHKFSQTQNDIGIKSLDQIDDGLIIRGHFHEKLSIDKKGKQLVVTLPPLCDLNKGIMPSFSEMTIFFIDNKINKVEIKHNIIVDNKVNQVSYITSDIVPSDNFYDNSLIEKVKVKTKRKDFTKKVNNLKDL